MTRRPDETPLSIVSDTSLRVRPVLVIGIVNNMPDAAFQATADQFETLLRQAAPDGFEVRLRFFSQPDRFHSPLTADPATRRHEAALDLWGAPLDGLIVTGAEPQAAHIADEPILPFLSKIVDWSEAGTVPTLWSCLAAHAAVYRLDGIARQSRDTKLFGVFRCDTVGEHPLLDGNIADWIIPHSRHNTLPEEQLAARGYRILTRSDLTGPDTFVRQSGAPHVFLNGHPEYDRTTLRSEYRRDIRRFLVGERADYPPMPTGYFPEDAVPKMMTFREAALERRATVSMADFPAAGASAMPWRATAIALFRNWLVDVASRMLDRAAVADVTIVPEATAPARRYPSPQSGPMPRVDPGRIQIGRQHL